MNADREHQPTPGTADLLDQLAAAHRRIDELEHRTSRRRMFGLAGAAAAGGAVSLLGAGQAAATTGFMRYGELNDAGLDPTGVMSDAAWTLTAINTNEMAGLRGASSGGGTGVLGIVETPTQAGYGVWGYVGGAAGYGVVASGGRSQLKLNVEYDAGPSVDTAHYRGEVAYDGATNTFWGCVADGTPGTWRVLAGASTAGAFHAISPKRVHDSRKPSSNPLSTGGSRTISVAHSINGSGASQNDNIVPAGATAVAYTVTVVNTVGANGYLGINEGGNDVITASTVNWTTAGTVIANSSVVMLDGNRNVQVNCGGTGTSTNFIIDVLGYYR